MRSRKDDNMILFTSQCNYGMKKSLDMEQDYTWKKPSQNIERMHLRRTRTPLYAMSELDSMQPIEWDLKW